jgi:hypothetical protein
VAQQRCRKVVRDLFEFESLQLPKDNIWRVPEEFSALIQKSKERCIPASNYLNQVFAHFPDEIMKMKLFQGKNQIHKVNTKLLRRRKVRGVITETEYNQLQSQLWYTDAALNKISTIELLEPKYVGIGAEDLTSNPNFAPFTADMDESAEEKNENLEKVLRTETPVEQEEKSNVELNYVNVNRQYPAV